MNPTLQVDRTDDHQIKPSIVDLFELYVDQEYSAETWDELLLDSNFEKLMHKYYPRYGDAVFHDLVNAVSSKTGRSIKFLLEDFGIFYRSYA